PNGAVPIYDTDKTINALGKTVQELEQEIAQAYAASKFQKPPYVTVTIADIAPRSIYVIGAVKAPAPYTISGLEQLTVLKAITLAGGPTTQSDLHGVTVQRVYPKTGATVSSPSLDLRRVQEGDQRDNLIVEPGDTIVVPDLLESNVMVLGQVEHQGPVVWHKGMRLSEA